MIVVPNQLNLIMKYIATMINDSTINFATPSHLVTQLIDYVVESILV